MRILNLIIKCGNPQKGCGCKLLYLLKWVFDSKKLFFINIFVITVIHCDVIYSQNTEIWGVSYGGVYNAGAIFSMDFKGQKFSLEHTFYKVQGAGPRGSLTEASNGKLYGMATNGGDNNNGIIFEFDPLDSTFTKKVDIGEGSVGASGHLIEAHNVKLYGTIIHGGNKKSGVIFEFDPSNSTYTKKIDLSNEKGSEPVGSLIQASNGLLYGLTISGGSQNEGVLFEYDLKSSTYTKKIDFSNGKGSRPLGSLIQASSGSLYGMTQKGGVNNKGVLFEYDLKSSTYTKKIDLSNEKGSEPFGSLIQASNGSLYGMTQKGGVNDKGVLFEYDPMSSTYTKKIDFGSEKGSHPGRSLVEANNGKLFGVTKKGGMNDKGVLFEYDPKGSTYVKRIDFGGEKGSGPRGSLIEASNGNLYGMTSGGGISDKGVLYEFDPSDSNYTKKLEFQASKEGHSPISLMRYDNDKLFGMTENGGKYGEGVLFGYDRSTSTYTKRVDFGDQKGKRPIPPIYKTNKGKLYGITQKGGSNDKGVLFEFKTEDSTYANELNFGEEKGSYPLCLTMGSKGRFYGLTFSGGKNGKGVIFEYRPATSSYNKLMHFQGEKDGSQRAFLIKASNGDLYGVTDRGGDNDVGILFEYDLSDSTFTQAVSFGDKKASSPRETLVQANDGKLYGMTSGGGAHDKGVLFEFDPSDSNYTEKLDFNSKIGFSTKDLLMKAKNGNLYGLTEGHGENNSWVLFEYSPSTSTYKKIREFDGKNSGRSAGGLIELSE